LQTTEEKQAQEVRKLKRELNMAEDKINTLTTQLSTNVTLAALHSLLLARSTFNVRVTGQTSSIIFPSPRNEYTGCVRLFSEMPARASEDYPGEPAYQKGETSLDFTEARGSEWQWHQLGHMQVCTSLQTDNHTNIPALRFYRPDALPDAQPTASKH